MIYPKEIRQAKLDSIFSMLKGCSNIVYDKMNLKINFIIPNPKPDEIDISELLLTIHDCEEAKMCQLFGDLLTGRVHSSSDNMLVVECTDEQKEKIKKMLGE